MRRAAFDWPSGVPKVSGADSAIRFSSFLIAARTSSAALLNVVGLRGADIGVPEYALSHGVWHSQARQVAPEAAPGSVPAVPLASPLSMILKSESELQRKLD